MSSIVRDLRTAFRSLRKSPGLTLVAVLSIGLGIGANTSIFSVLDPLLLRPLPYPHQERLVHVWTTNPAVGFDEQPLSGPELEEFRAEREIFEQIAAMQWRGHNLATGEHPQRITGLRVTADYFSLMGVKPLSGRVFTDDERQSAARVVVLGEGLWEREFGRDPRLVGSAVRVDGEPHTVVGVLPATFRFPNRSVELWTPLPPQSALTDRDQHTLTALARLQPGVSRERAQAAASAVAKRMARDHPASNRGTGALIEPLHRELYGEMFYLGSAIASLAVFFVLLIACANVANLLLVRAAAREREIAIRAALGAGRARMIRQVLTESVLLALIGGALGAVFAIWGVNALVSIIPADAPRVEDIALDVRALAFTTVLSALCGLLFGLAPASQVSRLTLTAALRDGARGSSVGRASGRLRNVLVVGEIALALVLLISTGLLIKGFINLRSRELGFDAAHVLTMSLAPPQTKYPSDVDVLTFYPRLLESVRAMPDVPEAGLTSILPMLGDSDVRFEIDGAPPADQRPAASYRAVSAEYLPTLRVPLLAGRWLDEHDRQDAPRVALVNRAMARQYFGGANPVGKRLITPLPEALEAAGSGSAEGRSGAPASWEIVGVVGDTREFGYDEIVPALIYFPYLQWPWRNMDLLVRSDTDPAALTAALRARIHELDPDQAIFAVQTLEKILEDVLQGDSILTKILSVLAIVALVMAAVGIYGVMAYAVSLRTQEIGVRVALGARESNVLRLVLGQGLRLSLLGVVLGLLGALASTRFLGFFLYGVNSVDPTTFAALALGLTAVALLACTVPARRAARVDPLIALRQE